MRLPSWVPTRREIISRTLKHVWRLGRWIEERARRAIQAEVKKDLRSSREWERFLYLLNRDGFYPPCAVCGDPITAVPDGQNHLLMGTPDSEWMHVLLPEDGFKAWDHRAVLDIDQSGAYTPNRGPGPTVPGDRS